MKAGKKSRDSGKRPSEPASKRSREDDSVTDPTALVGRSAAHNHPSLSALQLEDDDLPALPADEGPTDFSILSDPLVVLHPLTSTE